MIRLIVNADDLGAGPGRDRGIFRAFREGIVTSASLLANGPSFSQAVPAARAECLPVGVHLNLSEWRPLSGPIRGLTTRNGEFPGKSEARRRLAAGRPDPEELHRELVAQIQRVLDAGIVPDHLDSHQHIFLFPAVTQVILQVATQFGIHAIRLPWPAEPAEDPPGLPGEDLSLYRNLAPAARETVRQSGVASPNGLWGMPLLGRLDENSLYQLLRRIPSGTWELMVHPGHCDPGHPFGGPARELELAALTSPRVRSALADLGITPITFRDLQCAF